MKYNLWSTDTQVSDNGRGRLCDERIFLEKRSGNLVYLRFLCVQGDWLHAFGVHLEYKFGMFGHTRRLSSF